MVDCFVKDDDSEAVPVTAVAPDDLERLRSELPEPAAAWMATTRFAAKAGDICLLPAADGSLARVLFGLGADPGDLDLGPGRLPVGVPPGDYRLDATFDRPALAAVAWALGAYRFDRYRQNGGEARRLIVDDALAAEIAPAVDGVYLARDLINTPANDLGPAELAEAARRLAEKHDAVYSEVVGEGLLVENFPLIHAVGAAASAARAPRLVEFTWGDRDAPRLTLIGKGVCFDSGGLDIKPASGMTLMKKDMGGAATILGLASAVMDAALPVRLAVIVPAVENAIAAPAFRPGDVYRSRAGLTVEIGNTDAEGRLVLADALALASEKRPDLVIDLATLTGAARVALGPDIAPFYTDDDELADAVTASGRRLADPMWRLPMWKRYHAMLESRVADINNAGSSGFAGSITAALFLSKFVAPGTRWLHSDIFAWTPSTLPGRPEGGEANALRALFAMLVERYRP